MIIQNHSLPSRELRAALRYVRAHIGADVVFRFEFEDPAAKNAVFMTGDAYPGGGWISGYKEPHLIVIYAPTLSRPYPVTLPSQHVLEHWVDELVLVLGHEMQHARQYTMYPWEEVVQDKSHIFEDCAEEMALEVLGKWKRSKTRRNLLRETGARNGNQSVC